MAFFTDASRLQLQQMLDLMMEMNSHERQAHAIQSAKGNSPAGTYGHLWNAVCRFTEIETGLSMLNSGMDPNLGGGEDWASDIESLLSFIVFAQIEEFHGHELCRHWIDGDFSLQLFDLNQNREPNHRQMGCLWFYKNELVYWTTTLGCPMQDCVDSDAMLAHAIRCCSRPSKDALDEYTPAQLEFMEQHGEQIEQLAYELEHPNSWQS